MREEDGKLRGRCSNSDIKLRHTRQEGSTPPWNEKTTFKQLEHKLQLLKAGLPEQLQLTPENTQDRIYNGSDKYVLIHAMYMMCTVWLYREYMAMMPWKLTFPQGPLDEPLITEKPPHPNYWIDQAKACFGACKDFADLLHSVHSSSSNNRLVETPTVAFATFTVAWSSKSARSSIHTQLTAQLYIVSISPTWTPMAL